MTQSETITAPASPQQPRRLARHSAEVALAFAMGFALMQLVYGNHTGVPGHDSYYHIKMASMIPDEGLIHEMPWLRFTFFTDSSDKFVSHHYGFHSILVPFIFLSKWITGDFVPGAKWAMGTTFALTVVLVLTLLRTEGIRWRWLWILAIFFLPTQFFSRHAFIRAISPSMVFMLLITLLMFRRRHKLCALAVASYVHLYLGGVLYAPVIVALFAVASAIGPDDDREFPWRLVLWTAGAWCVAVVAHPYAGGMVEFLKLQVFGSGLTPDISVGREWKPYDGVWWFTMSAGTVLGIWVTALCLRLRFGSRLDAKATYLLLAHFAFLILTLKARRFVEYWPIFCLLSAAFLSAPLTARFANWVDELSDRQPDGTRPPWYHHKATAIALIAIGLGGSAAPGAALQWNQLRATAKCGFDIPAIQQMMTFLRENSEPESVIFTDDWDIFPVFFYHNSHNHYIVGLDPKFTQFREPELWERYVQVSRGNVPSNITFETIDASGKPETHSALATLQDIKTHFDADYVITDKDHTKLAQKLSKAKSFAKLIYPTTSYAQSKDQPYLVFRILREASANASPKQPSP